MGKGLGLWTARPPEGPPPALKAIDLRVVDDMLGNATWVSYDLIMIQHMKRQKGGSGSGAERYIGLLRSLGKKNVLDFLLSLMFVYAVGKPSSFLNKTEEIFRGRGNFPRLNRATGGCREQDSAFVNWFVIFPMSSNIR